VYSPSGSTSVDSSEDAHAIDGVGGDGVGGDGETTLHSLSHHPTPVAVVPLHPSSSSSSSSSSNPSDILSTSQSQSQSEVRERASAIRSSGGWAVSWPQLVYEPVLGILMNELFLRTTFCFSYHPTRH